MILKLDTKPFERIHRKLSYPIYLLRQTRSQYPVLYKSKPDNILLDMKNATAATLLTLPSYREQAL
jgi:hypothetical protein